MSIIDVQHLRKRYGDTVALRDLSLSIGEGEIFGILGPNGAGKTTLVESILPDALAAVGARWSGLTGVVTRTTTTGTPLAVRPEVEVALLRTGQEALANVAKHAQASTVALTLSYMDDIVSLDVRDDCVGFAARAAAPVRVGANGGFGLTAMRQRIEQLGGELAVESEPGGGTTIAASIPVGAG